MASPQQGHLQRPAGGAFTLIEMLVVISVIGLLVSLLVPVLTSAKDRSRSVMCLANQRSVGLACHYWADDHDQKLPGTETVYQDISPFLDRGVPADPSQWQRKNVPEVLFCPMDGDPYPDPYMGQLIELTSYCFNGAQTDYPMGAGRTISLGLFGGTESLEDIRGPAQCMLLGETSNYNIIADLEHPAAVEAFQRAATTVAMSMRRFHHRATSAFFHDGRMNVYFADGHGEPVAGKTAEPLPTALRPTGAIIDPSTAFWPDLSLPTAAESPRFWGPPYDKQP
jgi:prepilin-type N-terminal cleavage/methylation domain-containing protein/prepilin-type processing-associated H-X9-DG protein